MINSPGIYAPKLPGGFKSATVLCRGAISLRLKMECGILIMNAIPSELLTKISILDSTSLIEYNHRARIHHLRMGEKSWRRSSVGRAGDS